jgi:predicted metalloendopeptidase
VGGLYVRRYFPARAKAQIEAMVRELLAAYLERIDRLTWMAPATRAEAKAKVAALRIGIGYPDRWRDYADLKVVRGDAYGNFERSELATLHHHLRKLGAPVDRSEWVIVPQQVNAFNLPAMNALNFPAAILEPPFFDAHRPAAANYGAIGAIIGHEISHSFDDQGALFDALGRLHNWWTPEDFAHFHAAAGELVKQFDAYRPLPDLAVNGRQTLSENIADVAGVADAYDALHRSFAGREPKPLQGFTADQIFFLSFGQAWRSVLRDAALRERLVTDGHAPGEFRADTVRNLDVWYRTFDVQPGQRLYLAQPERVTVW